MKKTQDTRRKTQDAGRNELRRRNRFTNRRGVTLTEMAVVMGIVALLVGLTIPAVNMLFNSFESESGAKSMISAALASARAIAAKEQRYAGIRFQKRYDPNNPNLINAPQYIIFIIQDPAIMAYGFKAVDGIQPVKLPDSIGVMDLLYDPNDLLLPGDGQVNSNPEIENAIVFSDTTTFSIIFSPSGKLVIHEVRTRNRNGFTVNGPDSYDDIFNKIPMIRAGFGMFLQDDYYFGYSGIPKPPNFGIGPEFSRNNFYIYETKKFKSVNLRWTNYLWRVAQKPIYINAYTGTIIEQ